MVQIVINIESTVPYIFQIKKQNNLLAYQSSKMREQRRQIQEQGNSIADMKKHLEEWDQKFADLANEFARNRNKSSESKSSQTVASTSTSQPTYTPTHNVSVELSKLTECPFSKTTNLSQKIAESLSRISDMSSKAASLNFKFNAFNNKPSSNPSRVLSKSSTPATLSFISGRPRLRTSIEEFRTGLRSKLNGDGKKSEQPSERKRKVIDIIDNIVDAKRIKLTDQHDVNKLFDDMSDAGPRSPPSPSEQHKDDVAKQKKRPPSCLDDMDVVPTKRFWHPFI